MPMKWINGVYFYKYNSINYNCINEIKISHIDEPVLHDEYVLFENNKVVLIDTNKIIKFKRSSLKGYFDNGSFIRTKYVYISSFKFLNNSFVCELSINNCSEEYLYSETNKTCNFVCYLI